MASLFLSIPTAARQPGPAHPLLDCCRTPTTASPRLQPWLLHWINYPPVSRPALSFRAPWAGLIVFGSFPFCLLCCPCPSWPLAADHLRETGKPGEPLKEEPAQQALALVTQLPSQTGICWLPGPLSLKVAPAMEAEGVFSPGSLEAFAFSSLCLDSPPSSSSWNASLQLRWGPLPVEGEAASLMTP